MQHLETVKIPCTIEARTDQALLINNNERQVWVPLSQIDEEIEEPTGKMRIVATWVAKQEGLEAAAQDTNTMDLFGGRL